MSLRALTKFPAPWFGGKRDAAPLVWQALGDVDHFVEAFVGSGAVLLERPHPCNRAYYSETINDACGLLCNVHRSLAYHPQETAEAAAWPVCEADLLARHLAILRWCEERNLEHLMGDPTYCDPQIAGWWLWGLSCWIGAGWCAGDGPWVVDATSGRVVKRTAPGVRRKLPHLSTNGQGVNRQTTREPGVAGMPETHPSLADYRALIEADYAETGGYHPMTMPELRRWFHFLSARLRHVRIVNGDWRRVLTHGAMVNLPVLQGGVVGVFLDPPYASTERTGSLYRHDNVGTENIAADVRAWCLANGDDPQVRIVLAGYADEGHESLEAHGWTARPWYAHGFLKGGMANVGGCDTHQQGRERLWCSPHCLQPAGADVRQMALW